MNAVKITLVVLGVILGMAACGSQTLVSTKTVLTVIQK